MLGDIWYDAMNKELVFVMFGIKFCISKVQDEYCL